MDADLNTPMALACVGVLAGYALNPQKLVHFPTGAPIDIELGELKFRLKIAAELLGLLQHDPQAWFKDINIVVPAAQLKTSTSPPIVEVTKIDALTAARTAARKAKDFAKADRIRDELKKKGVVLEDKPDGTTDWRRE